MKYSPRFICRLLFVSIAFLLPAASMACIWIHGTTLDGAYESRNGMLSPKWLERSLKDDVSNHPNLFGQHIYRPKDPVASSNDEAVQVMLKGDPARAVMMLEKIESEHPGVYFTAANLGTSLELAGRDEDALKWILEGISRNPESHMNTEWLHARILEAKVKMKGDPEWLRKNTVTGIDSSKISEKAYMIPTAQGRMSMQDVQEALYGQLHVRMLLVKPQDAVVVQLLTELAVLESHSGLLEVALQYLDLAAQYGELSPEALASKEQWNKTIQITNPHPRLRNIAVKAKEIWAVSGSFLCISFSVLLLWFARRLHRQRQKRQSTGAV